MEGRISLCHDEIEQIRTGDGHRQFTRVERNRRSVGASVTGDEEDGLEYDPHRRREAFQGVAARAARCEWDISKELADVTVNGKPLGIVWKAPYQVEVTSALKPGDNQLTIKVTNLWVNRLIGDRQPGNTKKYTFTTFKPYTSDAPLVSSGLLGPVRIISIANN